MKGLSADSYEQMLAPLAPPMQNKPNGGHFDAKQWPQIDMFKDYH